MSRRGCKAFWWSLPGFETKVCGILSYLAQQLIPKDGSMTGSVVYVLLLVVGKEASDFNSHNFKPSPLLSYLWPALLHLLLVQILSSCAKTPGLWGMENLWTAWNPWNFSGKAIDRKPFVLQVLKPLLCFQFYLRFLGVFSLVVHRFPCHLLTFLHHTNAWCERKLERLTSEHWHYAKNLFWSAGYLDSCVIWLERPECYIEHL